MQERLNQLRREMSRKLKFGFISIPTFESWDWRNPDTKGIGGSETSHIEMARRLSEHGHEVRSYSPMEESGPVTGPGGVQWFKFDQLDLNWEPDVWVIYRAPHVANVLPPHIPKWIICQDVDYKTEYDPFTDENLGNLTRVVALCGIHASYLRNVYAKHADKVCVSSNGVKRELIEEISANPPERNPHRLMYASSPDRGMEFLLAKIFPRLRELVPDAELHIYYGFDNIDKVVAHYGENSSVAQKTRRLMKLLEQDGVTWHGRTPQRDLLVEWFKAGLWVHPSNFTETSCITCMDAQACGAIPVTSPLWAVAENVNYGTFVEGDVRNELIQSRFVMEAFKWMVKPEEQEAIRGDMMAWARTAFDWENWVGQWEGWARRDSALARQQRAATPVITNEEIDQYPGIDAKTLASTVEVSA